LPWFGGPKKDAFLYWGVDGIIVSPQGTTAPLEHIADFPNSDAGNWSAARRFVEQRRDAGLVFEITPG
jgi:hypothetical protein